MAEWARTKIASLVDSRSGAIAIGPFGSALKAELYTAEGVPVVRGQNIRQGRHLDMADVVFVPDSVAKRLARSLVYEGDLVFPHRGAIGAVGLVGDQRLLLSSSMMKLSVDRTRVEPSFLFYYFRGPGRRELLMRASTVGTPGIAQPLSSLKDIDVDLPPIAEQRAIAEVLGALDDKIAANTRLAATAHELAMCEFRRLETRTVERGVLRDLTELEYGKALPAAKRIAGAVHVYGSGGKSGSHETALVAGPGVILGRKGSVGMTYWSSADFFPIDTTFYAVPRAGVPMEYIYFLLRSLEFGERNSDSAVPGLNRNDAYSARVAIPEPTELQAFEAVASTLLAVHTQAVDENLALATTRDALLPQLMSGKLRVREAAEMAGL